MASTMSTMNTRVSVPVDAGAGVAGRAVAVGGRQAQHHPAADRDPDQSGVPARNDLAGADLERRRGAAVVGVVEDRSAPDLTQVVGDQPVTLHGDRAGSLGQDDPLQARHRVAGREGQRRLLAEGAAGGRQLICRPPARPQRSPAAPRARGSALHWRTRRRRYRDCWWIVLSVPDEQAASTINGTARTGREGASGILRVSTSERSATRPRLRNAEPLASMCATCAIPAVTRRQDCEVPQRPDPTCASLRTARHNLILVPPPNTSLRRPARRAAGVRAQW